MLLGTFFKGKDEKIKTYILIINEKFISFWDQKISSTVL